MIEEVWQYYAQHGRTLPWRLPEPNGSFDPYKILVSELMLQQTQVSRVEPKFLAFMQQFPTAQDLAAAPLADVLQAWNGLGYNRRAQYLHQAAKQVADIGTSPQTMDELVKLPGVGPNTAAAIINYAYNQATPFVETNIRTVYIHHYFADQNEPVSDKQLLPLIAETMDKEEPRQWFWALMDYGAHLKAEVGNVSQLSKHYVKQSTFQGSRRQIRGQVIRLLATSPLSLSKLRQQVSDQRLASVLEDLCHEGLVSKRKTIYHLAG